MVEGVRVRIVDVLEGRAEPETLGPYWRHDIALPLYELACQILRMPHAQRREEINKRAASIVPHIEEEVKRIHAIRSARK